MRWGVQTTWKGFGGRSPQTADCSVSVTLRLDTSFQARLSLVTGWILAAG